MMALTFLSLSLFLHFFAFHLLPLFSSNFIPLDFSTFHFKKPTKTVRDVFLQRQLPNKLPKDQITSGTKRGAQVVADVLWKDRREKEDGRTFSSKRVRITVEKMRTETSSEMKVSLDLGTKSRVERRWSIVGPTSFSILSLSRFLRMTLLSHLSFSLSLFLVSPLSSSLDGRRVLYLLCIKQGSPIRHFSFWEQMNLFLFPSLSHPSQFLFVHISIRLNHVSLSFLLSFFLRNEALSLQPTPHLLHSLSLGDFLFLSKKTKVSFYR